VVWCCSVVVIIEYGRQQKKRDRELADLNLKVAIAYALALIVFLLIYIAFYK
jgi:hypothetical protein